MSRSDFRFQRGQFVRCLITGFSGVVVARSDSITGCDRFCVQPTEIYDGKMVDALWFDDHLLEFDPEKTQQKIDLYRRPDQPPG